MKEEKEAVKEGKEQATTTEVTLGEHTITMYINSNGHRFYDIADKEAVDSWFNTHGHAWCIRLQAQLQQQDVL